MQPTKEIKKDAIIACWVDYNVVKLEKQKAIKQSNIIRLLSLLNISVHNIYFYICSFRGLDILMGSIAW